MSTTGKLSLNGLSKYLEELARAGKDVDAAARDALPVGGAPIVQEMQTLVPKDTHNLEEKIGVDGPYQDGNFIYVNVGVITDDKETAIYGNVQEFGSSSVAAQPYVRPSFRSRKGAAMKAMKDFLKSLGLL
jgi:HK97 gp10 family phage protein